LASFIGLGTSLAEFNGNKLCLVHARVLWKKNKINDYHTRIQNYKLIEHIHRGVNAKKVYMILYLSAFRTLSLSPPLHTIQLFCFNDDLNSVSNLFP